MKAEKIIYSGVSRIKISFEFDEDIIKKVKSLQGARWSSTFQSWHIPYTKEAFTMLKKLFPAVEYNSASRSSTMNTIAGLASGTLQKDNNQQFSQKNLIVITETPRSLFVSLPKNETDTQFLKSFRYFRWDKSNFVWVIPNWKNNLELIKSYFKDRFVRHEVKETANIQSDFTIPELSPTQILVVNSSFRQLKIFVIYNKHLVPLFRNLPLCKWSSTDKCWIMPYANKFLTELRALSLANGYEFKYEEECSSKVRSRKSKYDIENYRACPDEFIEKLKELRYSNNTIKSYKQLFEEFINYYPTESLEVISEEKIISFLRYLVNERCVSISYQNQAINAIKFYYERVLRGQRKIYTIDRPREEELLPEVLSEDEVAKIIRSIENVKHKAIIMTIYSGGLRISEVVNLKIKDIDSKRMQIRIEQSKGRKDRYTLLGNTTLKVLREYVKQFKPKNWLFEGESGSQYSTTSIRNIFRKAVHKVGISKRVTVHTLRHSFATHILEAGTDLRYIQSLLGHESSRTTEIYTHITTKGFDQIKNPLDKLDI
jgi:integrase/recombinase XerD